MEEVIKFPKVVERLLDESFMVLQHDTGELDPEWVWSRNILGAKFCKILKIEVPK